MNMFQINRKDYEEVIDALEALQYALESERESQRGLTNIDETRLAGGVGEVIRNGMQALLYTGVYDKAYRQSKNMKEKMESLLPLVNRIIIEAENLAWYLDTDTYAGSYYETDARAENSHIFRLDEDYISLVNQQCDELLAQGQLMKRQMESAIEQCGGLIDCSEEQSALNAAYRFITRIRDFQEAFQKYVNDVRDLDECLRQDFAALIDEVDVERGQVLKEAVQDRWELEIIYVFMCWMMRETMCLEM